MQYRELVDELLEHFDMQSNDWPVISVWANGGFTEGVVSDELYSILIALREARETDESEE